MTALVETPIGLMLLASRRSAVLLLSLAIVVMTAPVAAQGAKAILVIHSFGQDAAGRPSFDMAFARALREASGVTVDLYVETIDPNRFGGEAQARLTRDYLRERYAGKNIAALAAVYDSALDFLLDEREPLFPGLPIAALLTRNPQSLPDRVSVITSGSTIGKTATLALTLKPRATQVAVIDGAPPNAARNTVSAEVRSQLQALGLDLPVRFLTDLPLEELIVQLQALPPETIILMVTQFLGRGGEPIAQMDAIKELAEAARAPIYVTRDQLIGSGALGGMVMNIEIAATDLAKLALRMSVDGARRIPSAQVGVVSMFDWRELRRWGISEARLPAGSIIQFRQPGAWYLYKWYILAASALLVLQSALIGGLVVQGARRRRAEVAFRESASALRQSYEQNQDLAGRLINAQEEERTRIARDLHDDLSQQLASVSIMLSGLKRKVGKPGSELEVQQAISTLQSRAATAAAAVRTMSHELHPGVLEHLGLVSALKRHCADVEAHHDIKVWFYGVEGDLETLNPDVALCLFRVTQEALTNAVRHARAKAIRVELTWTPAATDLRIIDDGIGFVRGERAGSGLGLRSIDERVRLSRGAVTLESQIGKGTTLWVRIPNQVPCLE